MSPVTRPTPKNRRRLLFFYFLNLEEKKICLPTQVAKKHVDSLTSQFFFLSFFFSLVAFPMYFVSPIDNTLHIILFPSMLSETFRNLHDVDLARSVNDPRQLSGAVVQMTRCVCRCVCECARALACVYVCVRARTCVYVDVCARSCESRCVCLCAD